MEEEFNIKEEVKEVEEQQPTEDVERNYNKAEMVQRIEFLKHQFKSAEESLGRKDMEIKKLKISAIADNIASGEIKAVSNYWKGVVKNIIAGK